MRQLSPGSHVRLLVVAVRSRSSKVGTRSPVRRWDRNIHSEAKQISTLSSKLVRARLHQTRRERVRLTAICRSSHCKKWVLKVYDWKRFLYFRLVTLRRAGRLVYDKNVVIFSRSIRASPMRKITTLKLRLKRRCIFFSVNLQNISISQRFKTMRPKSNFRCDL